MFLFFSILFLLQKMMDSKVSKIKMIILTGNGFYMIVFVIAEVGRGSEARLQDALAAQFSPAPEPSCYKCCKLLFCLRLEGG